MKSKVKYTQNKLKEFDNLVRQSELKGFNNYLRNIGRIRLSRFIGKHGKEKYDAMWEIIKD